MEDFKEKLKKLRMGKAMPENRNEYWSEEDDDLLVELFDIPEGISEIAIRMGRTEISVVNRLNIKKLFKRQSRFRSESENGYRKTCRCKNCAREDCFYHGGCGLEKKDQEIA